MCAGGLVVFAASLAIVSAAAAAARDGSATALGAPPRPQLVRDVFLTKGPALDFLPTPRTENSESLIPTKKPLPASAVALAWGVSFVVVAVAAVTGWRGGDARGLRLVLPLFPADAAGDISSADSAHDDLWPTLAPLPSAGASRAS